MQTYKARILDIVARSIQSSVPELSRVLGISKPAVQYHIQKLINSGQIEMLRKPVGLLTRGRPTHYFRITSNRQPDNLVPLSDVLFTHHITDSATPDEKNEKIAHLAKSLSGAVPNNHSLIKRIDLCLSRLSELNFQPRWEVNQDGSRIHLRNCPYARILSSHPELCEIDHAILEVMLGVSVHCENLWRDQTDNQPDCVFFFTRQFLPS